MLLNEDEPRYRTEGELRAAIVQVLRSHGIAVAEHVPCAAGVADLVAGHNEIIYECKLRLTRTAMQQAMGQLLLYQASLNPAARLVVIGYPTFETPILTPHLASLGIRVLIWNDGMMGTGEWGMGVGEQGLGIWDGDAGTPDPLAALVPPLAPIPRPLVPTSRPPVPTPLRWNVAALAQARNLTNVPALARHMGLIRQALYGIWSGAAGQVNVEMLAQLCWALDAVPGDWFRFGSAVDGRRPLVWQVAEEAEARGFKMTQLSHATAMHQRSMGPIWHATAKAIMPATLARIARTLHAVHPFAIGDLFVWADTGR